MITIDNEILFAAVEERLAEGQRVELPLRGVSMKPTLRDGDVLTLEPAADTAVGDVVLFRYGGRHLLHRVIAVTDDTFTIQGDNCRGTETAHRKDIVAQLVAMRRGDKTITIGSRQWLCTSRRALLRKRLKNFLLRWLDRRGRRQLRPWYFVAVAFLMWAPLNGVGIPLDNFILGLRTDHLLHASVFIPCTSFLIDLWPRRRWLVWLLACGIGLFSEYVQYLLPFRKFDINDMVANVLGITLGWLLLLAIKKVYS